MQSALIEGTRTPCIVCAVRAVLAHVYQVCATNLRKRNLSCFIIINPVYDWSCLQVQCWSRHMQDRHHSHALLAPITTRPLPTPLCFNHRCRKHNCLGELFGSGNYLFLSCALNLSSSLVLSFKTYTHNQQTEENKAIHQFLSSFNFRSYDRTWWLFPPP